MSRTRTAIIGAGITGLANAWSAAKRGHDVTVYERSAAACGASVRNFGMVWPIGQPAGSSYEIACASRRLWQELADEAHVWLNPCGSLHLAHRDDEWEVLQQFCETGPREGIACELLSRDEVTNLTPAANPVGLIGAMVSDTEACVNPRTASARIAAWLADRFHVKFHFSTTVRSVDVGRVQTTCGRNEAFDRITVCSGADFESLFPECFAGSGLKKCKLQMLRTIVQPDGLRIGPHLAGGLTLRHYRNFELCPGLTKLKHRIAVETPELDRFGIHVMASQNNAGEVILGDSHEYDHEISPFDKTIIDELILRELKRMIHLPVWSIQERWHGIYAKHPDSPVFTAEPLPGVTIFNGAGGSGMTMSFGLAEEAWQRWHVGSRFDYKAEFGT